MLVHMTQRLLQQRTFEGAVHAVLDDVIALHGAEYGNVQLLIGDELVIVAQRGLLPAFLQAFRRVKKDDGCACGRALRLRMSVIIPDVEKDAEFASFRSEAKTAGFRAVQSTPLFTRDGNLLGVVSTHFAHVHEPTAIEMKILKGYAGIAAEHAFALLGDVPLAAKAEQMCEDLYAQIVDGPEPGIEAFPPTGPTLS